MKFVDNIDLEKYDEFVKNSANSNIFQSPSWVKVKNDWGNKRVAVLDDSGNVLATAQILTRSGLWYLNRGPILDYSNTKVLDFFLENIKKYAKENRAKMLKIDIPEPLRKAAINEFKESPIDSKKDSILESFAKAKFKHTGFTNNMSDTIQPRFETITELTDDLEMTFPKHTRRLIKDAEKRFVEVKRIGKENLDDLMFALSCTEKRKGITLRNREYFENIVDAYGDDCIIYTAYLNTKHALETSQNTEKEILKEISELKENMHKKKKTLEDRLTGTRNLIKLFTSIRDENSEDVQILCSAISIRYGNASEMLYAGMNDTFSKIPAQYMVYAETMKEFYKMGSTGTSMGGIENSLDDGLLLFKSHFSPKIVEHYGEFDFAINKTYKFMYDYALPLRRKVLKTMRSILKKN